MLTNDFEPGGPLHVANRWVEDVLHRGDLAAGWPLMAPQLRRRGIDSFLAHPLAAGADPEELSAVTAVDHPLWKIYAKGQTQIFREVWSYLNLEHCGWGDAHRPVGVDRVEVVYFDTGSPGPYVAPPEGADLPAAIFAMWLSEDGWLIEDYFHNHNPTGNP